MIGYCLVCDVFYEDTDSFSLHVKCGRDAREEPRDHRKSVGYALLPATRRTWHKVWTEEIDGPDW
jgi:hypothetical protein